MEKSELLSLEKNIPDTEYIKWKKHETLGRIGRAVGGEAALVLYNLIETFPNNFVVIENQGWMRADAKAYKKLRMNSIRYYECINGLIGTDFIIKITDDRGRQFYKINFEFIDSFSPENDSTSVDTNLQDNTIKKALIDTNLQEEMEEKV